MPPGALSAGGSAFSFRRRSPNAQLDLARLLVDLETRGVTDPRELRRLAIEETLLASHGRTSPSRW